MSPPQAAGFAEALSEVMTSELATKSDLKTDLGELRAWAQTQFAAIRVELASVRTEVLASKNETIRWVIGLFVAHLTITLGALFRLVG